MMGRVLIRYNNEVHYYIILTVFHDQMIGDCCQMCHFEHSEEKKKRNEFQNQKLDSVLVFLT